MTTAAPVLDLPDLAQPGQKTAGFVHLHVHTEFSKLDGLSRLGDLTQHVADMGQVAAAQTDHGTQAGAWKFVKACHKAGIKPILGVESYMALVPDGSDGSEAMAWDDERVRFAKFARQGVDAESGKTKRVTNNHLTILARNEAGWRNLCAISNAAEDSVYYKPQIDYALLKKHAEGLIVLTGCLGGPVASRVAQGDMVGAREALDHLIECVGVENVYVEIMEHGLEAEGKAHIKALAGLAEATGTRVVATNDSHFTRDHDCDAHDAWLTLSQSQPGKPVLLDDPNRWRFNGSGYWVRSEAEMRAIYPNATTWQTACDETVRLAARIEDSVIPFKALRLPKFPVPEPVVTRWALSGKVGERKYGTASAFYLHELVLKGAKQRYPVLTPELKERLKFEEGVITGMGLEDYFLIVGDVLDWARSDRGIPTAEFPLGEPGQKKPIRVGPGRGSAAGSALSYSLGIVMVEPLANGLLFERFLDVARVGMPDIDVDFEAERRDEVFTYLVARYGEEFIARIGAFQVAKTKRAIKDAARLLDLTPLGIKLADAVPVHQGKPHTFVKLADPSNAEAGEYRALVESNPDALRVVTLAQSFEDVAAGESIHAAGVIISDEPLTNLIPMRRLRDKNGDPVGVPVALWDGKDIDDFGMLKLDALSLRNLDIIAAAVDHIEATTGEIIDPDALPDPDTKGDPRVDKAFALLREGRTSGIFQLESSGITELCEQIAPTGFADLSALVALYRPGPMGAQMHTLYADRKNGRAEVDYGYLTRDPAEVAPIAAILDETYGVIAFQESLMTLAAEVAGFTADEKNQLRKAFSKKDREKMESLKAIFLDRGQVEMTLEDGRPKQAFAVKTLENLWVTFDASAEYLFNKSHSAAYGYLAYVTAFLKANWPTEYGAAILGATDKADKRLPALFALNQDGIEVLAPDVNKSKAVTAPDPEKPSAVRLGLGEIRDVGNNGRWVAHERDTHGPFLSLGDLMSRVKVPGPDGTPTAKLSITAVEGLIEAGALDGLGFPRLGLMLAVRATTPGSNVPVPDAEWSPLERSSRQRIRLGVALGDHPMRAYRDVLREFTFNLREDRWGNIFGGKPLPLHKVESVERGNVITVGVLTGWAEKTTRRGGKLANLTIEGTKSSMTGTVFNEAIVSMRRDGSTPQVGDILALAGQIKRRTITNMEQDPETGDEVEVTREVSELIGSHLQVVEVDTAPRFDLPEVRDDDRVNLATVLPFARRRAAQVAEEKAAAKAAGRASATKKAPVAKKAAPVIVATLFDDGLVDSDFAEDVATGHGIFLDPGAPAPAAERPVSPRRSDGIWEAVVFAENGVGLLPFLERLDDDGPDSAVLQRLFPLAPRAAKPEDQMDAINAVYKIRGGCRCRCTRCTGGSVCHHHGGDLDCTCKRGCAEAMTHSDEWLLIVAAESHRVASARVNDIVFDHPAWEACDGHPGWFRAPLSAFSTTLIETPAAA